VNFKQGCVVQELLFHATPYRTYPTKEDTLSQCSKQNTHYLKGHDPTKISKFRSLKEARNSFFGLGVYLLKSKFRIEDKLRFP